MNRARSSATITSGGSRLTEARALTVMPSGRSRTRAVTTATPVAKCPIALRKSPLETVMPAGYGERTPCQTLRPGLPSADGHPLRRRHAGNAHRARLHGRDGGPGGRAVRRLHAARRPEFPDLGAADATAVPPGAGDREARGGRDQPGARA